MGLSEGQLTTWHFASRWGHEGRERGVYQGGSPIFLLLLTNPRSDLLSGCCTPLVRNRSLKGRHYPRHQEVGVFRDHFRDCPPYPSISSHFLNISVWMPCRHFELITSRTELLSNIFPLLPQTCFSFSVPYTENDTTIPSKPAHPLDLPLDAQHWPPRPVDSNHCIFI